MTAGTHIRVLAAATLLAAAGAAQSLDAAKMAFVETSVATKQGFVGQAISVRIRFGINKRFLRDHVIQNFATDLELPVRLTVSWWNRAQSAKTFDRTPPVETPGNLLRHLLNGALHKASIVETADRNDFLVGELRRTLAATEPGTIQLAAARMRFDFATRFEDDFIHGRVAEDPQTATVESSATALAIRELPTKNRPTTFKDAVGTFRMQAQASATKVRVGDSLRLTLRLEGSGNHRSLSIPQLSLPGFHVLGSVANRSGNRSTFFFDLRVLQVVRSIPPVSFSFFDPTTPSYQTIQSVAIPITVARPPTPSSAPPDNPPPTVKPDLLDDRPMPANAGSTFRAGKRAYVAGDFDAAARHFADALKLNTNNPGPVWFELGNTAFRRNRLAESALFFRRAQATMPFDRRAAFNLDASRRLLGLEGSSMRQSQIWVSDLLRSNIGVVSLALLLLAGVAGLTFGRRRRWLLVSSVACLFLAIVGWWLATKDCREGMVIGPGAQLYSQPHPQEPTLRPLPRGSTVQVLEMSDRWMRIAAAGATGWARRSTVALIRPGDTTPE